MHLQLHERRGPRRLFDFVSISFRQWSGRKKKGKRTIETPGQERRSTRESADGDEEDGHVLDVRRDIRTQHGEADDGDGRKQRQPDAALASAVRDERDEDGDETGQDVGRHRVQLGLGGGPTQVGEQCGHEKRDALHGDVDEEEAERADVVVYVENCPLDVVHLDFLVGIGLVVDHEALRGDELLALRQEGALFGFRGHEERRHHAEEHGNQAFEEENIAPSVNRSSRDAPARNKTGIFSFSSSRKIWECLRKTSGQKTSKSSGHGCGRHEDSDAEQQLLSPVEAAKVERNTSINPHQLCMKSANRIQELTHGIVPPSNIPRKVRATISSAKLCTNAVHRETNPKPATRKGTMGEFS